MITKRQVLLSICEHPGWYPSEQSSTIDRHLNELQGEGWIIPRLDGFEASAQALDGYPDFAGQGDIANRDAPIKSPNGEHADSVAAVVPIERVATMLAALLGELPLPRVAALTALTPAQLPRDEATWHVARTLARRMAL